MPWSQDAFSVKFVDLVAKYPERVRTIYRYKIENYGTTRDKVLAVPYHDLFMHLSAPVELLVLLDNYKDTHTSIGTGSNQEPGAQKVLLNDSPTYILQDFEPSDSNSSIYVYSDVKFDNNSVVWTDRIFKRTIGASIEPALQETIFKNGLTNEETNVQNVLSLQKWDISITAESSSFVVYSSDNLKYIKGDNEIKVVTDGIFAEMETLGHKNSFRYQTDYTIDIDKNKYLIMQATATKIKPTLTLSTDTFDTTKTLDAIIAEKFITKDNTTFVSAKKIFGADEINIGKGGAVNDLWHAFTSIIFNSHQYLDRYSKYKITDESSPNFGKIKFFDLENLMYGITVTEELAESPDKINETILIAWEQNHASSLTNSDDLKELFKRVKLTLGMLGEFVPSSSSFGNYDKINKIAFNYSFAPEDMTILPQQDFKMKLISERYSFDADAKKIKNIKDQFLIASSNKTFELDSPLTLNQPPEKFIETAKISRPGSVDISTPNFLNYMWLMQIPDTVDFDQILGKSNPLDISKIKTKDMSIDIHSSDALFGLTTAGSSLTGDNIDNYIIANYSVTGRTVQKGSGKVQCIYYNKDTHTSKECLETKDNPYNGHSYCARYGTKYTYTITSFYVLTWISVLNPTEGDVTKLQLPYNLTMASLHDFKITHGISDSEFIFKPERVIASPDANHRITKLSIKTALDSKNEIHLTGVFSEPDPNDPNATIEKEEEIIIDLKRNIDQTIIQKGLIF